MMFFENGNTMANFAKSMRRQSFLWKWLRAAAKFSVAEVFAVPPLKELVTIVSM
jgi:hypothetical protein